MVIHKQRTYKKLISFLFLCVYLLNFMPGLVGFAETSSTATIEGAITWPERDPNTGLASFDSQYGIVINGVITSSTNSIAEAYIIMMDNNNNHVTYDVTNKVFGTSTNQIDAYKFSIGDTSTDNGNYDYTEWGISWSYIGDLNFSEGNYTANVIFEDSQNNVFQIDTLNFTYEIVAPATTITATMDVPTIGSSQHNYPNIDFSGEIDGQVSSGHLEFKNTDNNTWMWVEDNDSDGEADPLSNGVTYNANRGGALAILIDTTLNSNGKYDWHATLHTTNLNGSLNHFKFGNYTVYLQLDDGGDNQYLDVAQININPVITPIGATFVSPTANQIIDDALTLNGEYEGTDIETTSGKLSFEYYGNDSVSDGYVVDDGTNVTIDVESAKTKFAPTGVPLLNHSNYTWQYAMESRVINHWPEGKYKAHIYIQGKYDNASYTEVSEFFEIKRTPEITSAVTSLSIVDHNDINYFNADNLTISGTTNAAEGSTIEINIVSPTNFSSWQTVTKTAITDAQGNFTATNINVSHNPDAAATNPYDIAIEANVENSTATPYSLGTSKVTTPPPVPADFTAEATNTGTINLSWTKVDDYINYYEIRRSLDNNYSNSASIANSTNGNFVISKDSISYEDTGVSDGTTYYYWIVTQSTKYQSNSYITNSQMGISESPVIATASVPVSTDPRITSVDGIVEEVDEAGNWSAPVVLNIDYQSYTSPTTELKVEITSKRTGNSISSVNGDINLEVLNNNLVATVNSGLRIGTYFAELIDASTDATIASNTFTVTNTDHPILYYVEPQVMPAGMDYISFRMQGCNLDKLVLPITAYLKGNDNGIISTQSEQGLGCVVDGDWLNVSLKTLSPSGAAPVSTGIEITDESLPKQNIEILPGSDTIMFEDGPMLSGEVHPWAMAPGTYAEIQVELMGYNFTIANISNYTLKMLKTDGTEVASTSASLHNDFGVEQEIVGIFTNLNLNYGQYELQLVDNSNSNPVPCVDIPAIQVIDGPVVLDAYADDGTTIKIEGYGFNSINNLSVKLNDQAISNVTKNSDTEITVVEPLSSDFNEIVVFDGAEQIMQTMEFEYNAGADTTSPVINLIGEDIVYVELGGNYSEEGADALDGTQNISEDIVIGGDQVNTDLTGVYTITYNVSNNEGNTAEEVVRIVIVHNGDLLYLSPDNYIEEGYEAINLSLNDNYGYLWNVNDENRISITIGNEDGLTNNQPVISSFTEDEITFNLPEGLIEGFYIISVLDTSESIPVVVAETGLEIGFSYIPMVCLEPGQLQSNYPNNQEIKIKPNDQVLWNSGNTVEVILYPTIYDEIEDNDIPVFADIKQNWIFENISEPNQVLSINLNAGLADGLYFLGIYNGSISNEAMDMAYLFIGEMPSEIEIIPDYNNQTITVNDVTPDTCIWTNNEVLTVILIDSSYAEQEIASITVNDTILNNKSFNISLPTNLPDGEYTVLVRNAANDYYGEEIITIGSQTPPQSNSLIVWDFPNSSMPDVQTVTVAGKVENPVAGLSTISLAFNNKTPIDVTLDQDNSFSQLVTLEDGINFITLTYEDENNVYDSFCREFYYNTTWMEVDYVYDDVNLTFSGNIDLMVNSADLPTSVSSLTGKLYEVVDGVITQLQDIAFTENVDQADQYVYLDLTPYSNTEYYIELFDQSNNCVGYSRFETYPHAVVTSEYSSSTAAHTITGFLAFAENLNSVKIALNNDAFESLQYDTDQNFSHQVTLNPGKNNIEIEIETFDGSMSRFGYGVYYDDGSVTQPVIELTSNDTDHVYYPGQSIKFNIANIDVPDLAVKFFRFDPDNFDPNNIDLNNLISARCMGLSDSEYLLGNYNSTTNKYEFSITVHDTSDFAWPLFIELGSVATDGYQKISGQILPLRDFSAPNPIYAMTNVYIPQPPAKMGINLISEPALPDITNLRETPGITFTAQETNGTKIGSIEIGDANYLINVLAVDGDGYPELIKLLQALKITYDETTNEMTAGINTGMLTFLANTPATITFYNVSSYLGLPLTNENFKNLIGLSVFNNEDEEIFEFDNYLGGDPSYDPVNDTISIEVKHFTSYIISGPPVNISIASNNTNPQLAKENDVISLLITTEEAMTTAPTVTILSQNAAVTDGGDNNPLTWLASYTVPNTSVNGDATFVVDFGGGNTMNYTTDGSSVYVDTTPPVVNITSPADGYVTGNTTINVYGTVNEQVVAVQVNGQNATLVNNNFSYDGVALSSGVNTITVTATDLAGNTSSESITITLDESAPALNVDNLNSTTYTSQPSITITGSSEAGATLIINVNETREVSAEINSNGSFSHTITLSEGSSNIEIVVTDAQNNSTTWNGVVHVDTAAPNNPIITLDPVNGISNSNVNVTIRDDGDNGVSGIEKVQYKVNEGQWQDYSSALNITETCTVSAKAIDKAGNEAVAGANIVIDAIAPEVNITSSLDNDVDKITNESVIVTVALSDVGGSEIASTDGLVGFSIEQGNYTKTFSEEGPYTVNVAVQDNAGNSNSASLTFTIDKTAPVTTLSVDQTDVNNGIYKTNPEISLSVDDTAATIMYNLDGSNSYNTYTAPFTISTEGDTTVTYYAIDAVGNEETIQAKTFTVDTVKPNTILSASPEQPNGDNGIYITNPEISLSVNENATIKYSLDGGINFNDYTGPFTISDEGSTTVTYYAIDAAGNIEEVKPPAGFTIDTIAPLASSISIESNNSDNTLAKAGDTITLSIVTNEHINKPIITIQGAAATVSQGTDTQHWQATQIVESGTANGNVSFNINIKDEAGNETSNISNVTDNSAVEVDTQQPSLSSVTISSDNMNSSAAARNGETITLAFIANEPLQVPQVTIHGTDATVTQGADNQHWQATYQVNVQAVDLTTSFNIVAKDLAGNEVIVTSTTDNSQVQIDTIIPTTSVAIAPATADGLNDWYITQPTVELSASNEANVTHYYSINNKEFIKYQGAISVPDGSYVITYYGVDEAGNGEGYQTLAIKYDEQKPIIKSAAEKSNKTTFKKGDKLQLSIVAEPDCTAIARFGNSISFPVVESNQFKGYYSGEYNIVDALEETNNIIVTFTAPSGLNIDLELPQITIDSDVPGIKGVSHNGKGTKDYLFKAGESLTISLEGESNHQAWAELHFPNGDIYHLPEEGSGDGSQYRLPLVEDTNKAGTYSTSVTVHDGMNVNDLIIHGFLKDEAGNVSSKTANDPIGFDTIAPSVQLNIDGQQGRLGIYNSINNATLSTNDVSATIYYKESSQSAYSIYNNNVLFANDGINEIYYYAEDKAGNSSAIASQTIVKDTEAPTAPTNIIIRDSNGDVTGSVTNKKVVNVRGEGLPSDVWRVYLVANGKQIAYLEPKSTTSFEFEDVTLPQLGTNKFTFTTFVKDKSGQKGESSTAVAVEKDTVGPVFKFNVNHETNTYTATASEAIVGNPAAIGAEVIIDGVTEANGWEFIKVNDTLSYTTTQAATGSIVVKLTASDVAGNTTTSTYSRTVFVPTQENTVDFGLGAFNIPAGAILGDNANIKANTENQVAAPADVDIMVPPIDFTASSGGNNVTTFKKPLVLRFDVGMPNELQAQGINASQIDIYYYNDSTGEWEEQHGTYDPSTGVITVSVTHFSVYGVMADTTPPVLTITSPTEEQAFNINTVTVEGSSEPGAVILVNDTQYVAEVPSDGQFSIADVPLAEGVNSLVITAADSAGNESGVTLSVTSDTVAPVISTDTTALYTTASSVTINATATDQSNTNLVVKLDGVEMGSSTTGSITTNVPLINEGTYTVTVTAVDSVNNQSTATKVITRDNTAPNINVSGNGIITANANINVVGTVNETVQWVKVNGVNADINGNDFSLANVALSEGLNTINVSARDLAGNIAVATIEVTRDSNAPTLNITNPINTVFTFNNDMVISGEAEAELRLTISVNGSALVQKLVAQSGEINESITLDDGVNNIAVSVADELDRTSTWNGTVYVDMVNPSINITAPVDGTTVRSSTVTITGTVTDNLDASGNTLTVSCGSAETTVNNGQFSLNVNLNSGQNNLTVIALDKAGNSASDTVNVTYRRTTSSGGSSSTPPPSGGVVDNKLSDNEITVSQEQQETAEQIIVTKNVTVTTSALAQAKVAAEQKDSKVTLEMPPVAEIIDSEKTVVQKSKLTLSNTQVAFVKNTGLTVKGPEGTEIEMPTELLSALAKASEQLELETYKVNKTVAKQNVGARDEVYHAEEINTNFSGTTTLRFNAPADVDAGLLKIKVMHSDGTEETITPQVKTIDGKDYLEFTVDKFSTFIVYKPGETKQIKLTLNQQNASINGESYMLDAVPFIKEGTVRTLVPVRFVSEALGAKVTWLPTTRQVQIEDAKEILLTIGSAEVLVDNQKTMIDCAAEIINTRTYVPLRFVSETLGATVDYNGATKEITIVR